MVYPQGNSWWKKQGEGFYILDKWVPIQLIPGHSIMQGIFLIQGSNPGLLHRGQILYHLSHQGSPSLFFCFQTVSEAGDRWTPGSIHNCPLDYISLGSKNMGFRPDIYNESPVYISRDRLGGLQIRHLLSASCLHFETEIITETE